ncbi:MAG: GGDEF domain-containing protein [Solirubrobacteraceae bacterium]|nr:GGDEF domain-containing protein [Solirubrobacteraceae bacterium]
MPIRKFGSSSSRLHSVATVTDAQALRRTAGFASFIAFAMLLMTTVLPDPDTSDHRRLYFVALVPLALGLILTLVPRLPDRAIKLLAISGTICAVSLMVGAILPMGAALMFYCWPAVLAGYFCTRREIAWNLALLGVTAAIALVVSQSPEITGSTWMATVAVSAIVMLSVRGLIEKLTEAATVDELSGLINRRTFGPILEREVERARTSGLPISVVLFDLDHFKLVNDRFGHAAGDEAIHLFGTLLQAEIRDIDVAARTGGEEFVALLFDADAAAAQRWAEGIGALLIADTVDEQVALSVSAGVATAGLSAVTAEELLLAADRALYAAKEGGRRQVVVATGDQPPLAVAA